MEQESKPTVKYRVLDTQVRHILDNPAWNALISGNKKLSSGNKNARYFTSEISRFAGIASNSNSNFKALYDCLPPETTVSLFSEDKLLIPPAWQILNHIRVLQLVYETPLSMEITGRDIVRLKDNHIPAILALTKLTAPGPFLNRTIDFGHYYGIFDNGQLVAMTGQRLQPLPYVEISAVCNHPRHLGKGYASRLIINQVNRIQAAGNIPFLHVVTDNLHAINLYKKLGFVTRKEMSISVIKRH